MVLNGHAQSAENLPSRRGGKMQWIVQMGITELTFCQCLLEGSHSVVISYTHKNDGSIFLKIVLKSLRGMFRLCLLSHTWPIAAWIGRACPTVCLGEFQKIVGCIPHCSDVGKNMCVGGARKFQLLLGNLTGIFLKRNLLLAASHYLPELSPRSVFRIF